MNEHCGFIDFTIASHVGAFVHINRWKCAPYQIALEYLEWLVDAILNGEERVSWSARMA